MKQFLPRIIMFAGILLSFTLTTHIESYAQSQLGPHIGLNLDAEDIFIGANGHFPLGANSRNPVVFNPRLDFYLKDNITLLGLNGNFYYQFGPENDRVQFHAGAGLLVLYASNNNASDTDFGLNLFGGLKFTAGGIRWLSQLEISISGGNDVELIFGPIFTL